MKENNIPFNDVVISSRIRLARNLNDYPFPSRLEETQRDEVISKVSDAIIHSNSAISNSFSLLKMEELDDIHAKALVEEHLISIELANKRKGKGVLINNERNVSIMINEEDHLRIQCMGKGLCIKELLDTANHIDDLLDENLLYAFHPNLGYLTHCPTNLGTALRASVMLHLPALTMGGYMENLVAGVSKLGLTVRGIYGEGSDAIGAVYQLSNQVTLGISEKETLQKLSNIIESIVAQELNGREMYLKNSPDVAKDRFYRAYGILSGAYVLSSKEFSSLYSDLRLGAACEVLNLLPLDKLDALYIKAQTGNLLKDAGKMLSASQRDVRRAKLIRNTLKEMENSQKGS